MNEDDTMLADIVAAFGNGTMSSIGMSAERGGLTYIFRIKREIEPPIGFVERHTETLIPLFEEWERKRRERKGQS